MNNIANVRAFAIQVRPILDFPSPIIPDELLEAYGDFYQEQRLDCGFEWFCRMPERFGFLRPVQCSVGEPTRRPLRMQRLIAGFLLAAENCRLPYYG